MPLNRELRRFVSRASWGVVKTLGGLILYEIAFGVALATTGGGKSARTVHRASRRADDIADLLFASLDPSKIRGALYQLRRKGLISTVKGKWYEAQLTKRGFEELGQHAPRYREQRPWDKRVYLVSYDIEEEDQQLRKLLHRFLLDIRCAPIQKSAFLSVYNPRGLIRSWQQEHLASGDILVSDLGPDGSFGDRPLPEMVHDAYRLGDINRDYSKFLQLFPVSVRNNPSRRLSAWFNFHSILEKDPQLPFELLPDDWLGDRAYERLQRFTGHTPLLPTNDSSSAK